MKYLICIFILFVFIYIFTKPVKEFSEFSPELKEDKIVKILDEEKISNILLEDYIIGVVACEMPASFEMEALKAQAVASRTFALEKMSKTNEYDLENSTSDQCYITIDDMHEKWKTGYNKYYTKIKNAVNETAGEYLTYQDKIIKAFYFSTSNGYTENVQSVFGEDLDYLVSTESLWDKNVSSYEKTITMSKKEFLSGLNIQDSNIYNIEINERNETNRVEYITINNTKFKGTTFRSLLKIRSTDFDITNKENVVTITTRGYGHGVGLSQYGSNAMANEGHNYKEILLHYYKGTEIKNV